MSWLDRLLGRPTVVAPPEPPREVDVRGCHTVVTFDDGTRVRFTHYGQWTREKHYRRSHDDWYDLVRTGIWRATQFRDATEPIALGNGIAYPRHRVRRYDLEAFEHLAVESYTPRRADIVYPYVAEELPDGAR